jgi:glutamate synthase (NADPH/NADH) large chain
MDRNGLRPCRYTITKDGFMVLASETGVLDFSPEQVAQKGALGPGEMILVDLEQKRVLKNTEVKAFYSRRHPYRRWVNENKITLHGFFNDVAPVTPNIVNLTFRQNLFGYTREDLRIIIGQMASKGYEPIGSMGKDTPLAVFSEKPQLLYSYFKQIFAQITNPAIDPIREELVMSLMTFIGNEGNILSEIPQNSRLIKLQNPIISNEDLERISNLDLKNFWTTTLQMGFPAGGTADKLEESLDQLCRAAEASVDSGCPIIILSDRNLPEKLAPIPALLATSAVNHHLIRKDKRTRADIIVETGEAREIQHIALLLGFGASAVNPYLAFETVADMALKKILDSDVGVTKAIGNYMAALCKGLLKIMSKMGISTLRSYRNAQVFEAVGLSSDIIEKYFPETSSRIEGIGLAEIAAEANARYEYAYSNPQHNSPTELDSGGDYAYRADGERHLWNPETISKLQIATRHNDSKLYKEYAKLINDQTKNIYTLRGMFKFKKTEPVPIEEVEPASEIIKRFATSAMSFGSISRETHETLAIAMNRLGAKSNSGEGGEDPDRYKPLPNGDNRASAVKQVASGRFGVTAEYLVNCREIQIKIAQGAKPGEGGQLPGHKVDAEIAKVRYSTPGVTLISPPPHHDIYSIEDIKQLIFDLRNVNPQARVAVKLVSEVGVGTIAAGVAKANADMVLISGYDGGTGASPLSSIKHAGVPWELGLAETQQTLVLNNLRSRIRVQADGQMNLLKMNEAIDFWKANGLDFSKIFQPATDNPKIPTRCIEKHDYGLEEVLDKQLIECARDALEKGKPVKIELPIRNVNLTTGAMLSGEISKRYGGQGLQEDTVTCTFRGAAGQSFGAFCTHGITMILEGEANDYLNFICGNVLLYGATSGEAYIYGRVGERFAIRNSGAYAVVEGVGDHGCEYMTGGRIVILGDTGVNFAAGMSGGIAYVYDPTSALDGRCNLAMVDLEIVIDSKDITELKEMITKHLKYTGSKKAKYILDNWEECLTLFVKVFPMEYRHVLGQMMKEDEATEREEEIER